MQLRLEIQSSLPAVKYLNITSKKICHHIQTYGAYDIQFASPVKLAIAYKNGYQVNMSRFFIQLEFTKFVLQYVYNKTIL